MKRRSSTKQQPEYVFFTDRDLGHIVRDALAQGGVPVERHDSHFSQNTSDAEWLRAVGARGQTSDRTRLACGIDQSIISKLELGKHAPRLGTLSPNRDGHWVPRTGNGATSIRRSQKLVVGLCFRQLT